VTIRLNGRDQQAPPGATILSMLVTDGLPPARVAVELNGRIVSRAAYDHERLREGDVVEVVHFVGGG
jgi:thiamine biosynthesis protein ThiS